MKRNLVVFTAGIVLFLLVVVVSSWASYRASYSSFECNRATKELRATDKYCNSFGEYLFDFVTFKIEN